MISLFVTIVLLVLIIILVHFLLKKLLDKKSSEHEEVTESQTSENTIRTDSNIPLTRNSTVHYTQHPLHTGNANTNNMDNATKALTKKDQIKMEKKKLKQDHREYTKLMLEEKKLKEQMKEKEYQEREMKREEERKQEEEIIRKIKEEQEKKESAIYDQWKDQFTVAEEGEEMADFDSEDLINDFINYIKIRKVVSLEDLSGVFKINPNDIVDRLNLLEEQGKITGIVDDRGKYIYLTEKEVGAIEKIFMQRGRISKTDLIKECNKIIRFIPTEEDKLKILEEQNKVWKSFEAEVEKNNNQNK